MQKLEKAGARLTNCSTYIEWIGLPGVAIACCFGWIGIACVLLTFVL